MLVAVGLSSENTRSEENPLSVFGVDNVRVLPAMDKRWSFDILVIEIWY